MADSDSFIQKFLKGGQSRIVAALVVTALVGAGLGFIMLRGSTDQALLYSGLDLTESAEISGRLDQANISYTIRGDGASIFVDRDQVLDARMMLSEEGLPTRGAMGYEIFDKTEALGTTSFVQNINRVRALEGELARTVSSLDNVRGARVHLVLPERRLFERDAQTASASVVMSVAGRGMTPAQVRAIRNLVAGSVPNLEVNRITLLDDKGRLLAAGAENGEGGFGDGNVDERQTSIEQQIRSKVLTVVESVTGPGAARVEVAADIDFNRITQSSEIFDPDGRVIRSATTTEDSNRETTTDPNGTVTAANNIPEGGDVEAGNSPTSQTESNHIQETTNYEISKTTKTEITEGGRIRKISVAVALDDVRIAGADDEPASFAPRTPEEIASIAKLVKSAVGYDETRGDIVEVVNVSFMRPETSLDLAIEEPNMLGLTKDDIMRIAEVAALFVGAILLILFVLRPLVKGLMNPASNEDSFYGGEAALPGMGRGNTKSVQMSENLVLPGAAGGNSANTESEDEDPMSGLGLDVARITGRVNASSVKKISEVVESHPDESIQIIRSWLSEDVNKGSDAA
ncbi:flagellar basal-body MS-ring/collar protein FliF [Hirschia litorea]|uniref:Flagellar M-ring protein n=1 Tax=Hirschia litorea TaxID=1199156 RepID=A0ABW2IJZ8_9PROT